MSEPEFQNTMPLSGEFWVMVDSDRIGCQISNRFHWSIRNGKKVLIQNNAIVSPLLYPEIGIFITGILHKE